MILKDTLLILKKRVCRPTFIDGDILSCAVACFVLDGNRYKEWDFKVIVSNEQFAYNVTDYKLTKVTDVDFRQNGFIYDDKYNLYNIFISRKRKGESYV